DARNGDDAGILDRDINAAEDALGLVVKRGDAGLVSDIDDHRVSRAAGLLDRSGNGVDSRLVGGDDDIGALGRKSPRDRLANTPASSRDDHGLFFKTFHAAIPLSSAATNRSAVNLSVIRTSTYPPSSALRMAVALRSPPATATTRGRAFSSASEMPMTRSSKG